jgi:hypothetical protein
MDGALLAVNAGQLRVLLTQGFLDPSDPKWLISIILVSSSIVAQLVMLVILGVLANNNFANRAKKGFINIMHDIVLILTGIIFCVNVITSVFIQVDFTEILNKVTSASIWTVSNSPEAEYNSK